MKMMNLTDPICNMSDAVIVLPSRPQNAVSFGWGDFPAVSATVPTFPMQPSFCGMKRTLPSFPMLDESSGSSSEDDSFLSELSSMDLSVTASEDMASSLTKQNEERRVLRFSVVCVQEHALILGDHPMSDEYPLSLDWKHDSPIEYDIDEYEHHYSKSTTNYGSTPRRMTAADRRLRLAAVNGESISQVYEEEKRRRRQLLQGSQCAVMLNGFLTQGDDSDVYSPSPIRLCGDV
mmetsp:Transcript_4347/g.5709  ORF Transcript_4347/g.5709 Transcript_4347/m.5709 type:complete len:234 (+) Transcript_4347:167-868(+)|eukprot:CAMPEP_0198144328 /NCGR_PEP_ID=MMETSP1443-20131203/14595_1 /TAXON_ID=186043 /ORGANISM="Entomoneis sp., Strain CCMP2396" /LENGTH=233 /DNA_ID=CAMNT_0043807699 /DNA_START=150 /DNA_END=851 /DNA_ORIENTATION=+